MAFGFSPSKSRSSSSSPVQSKARSEPKPHRQLPTTNCLPQGSRSTPPSTPPSRLPSRSTSSRPPASPLTPPASSTAKLARPPPTRTFTLPHARNASVQSPPPTPPASLARVISATASSKSPSPAAAPSGIPRPPQSFLQRITSRSNHAAPASAPTPAPAPPVPPTPIPAPVGTSRVLGLAIEWNHPHPSSHLARSPSIDLPRSSSEGLGLSVSPTSYPYERKRDRKSWSEQFAGLDTRRVGVRMGSLDGRDVPDRVEVVDLDIEVEGGSEEEGEADEFGRIGRSMRFGNSGRAGSSFDAASEGGWGGVAGERTSLDGMRPTWTRGPSMSSALSSSTSPQISAALFGTRSSGSGTPIRMSPSASLSSLANIGPPIPRGPNHLITHSRSADSMGPTPVLLPPTFTAPPPPLESPPPTVVPLPASPFLEASTPLPSSPAPFLRGNAGFRPPSTRRTYTPPASDPPPAPVELEDRYTSLPPRRTIRGGRTIQRRADSPTAAWMARAEQEDNDASARESDSSSVRTSEESSRANTTDATSTEEHDAGAEEEEKQKMREEARKKLVGLTVAAPGVPASDAEDEVFSTPPLSPSTSSTPPSPTPRTRRRTSKEILPPPAYKLGIPRSPRSLQIARDFSPPPRSAPLPPALSPTPTYQPLSPTLSEEGWIVSISSSPLATPNEDGSLTYTLTLRPSQPTALSTPPLSPSPSGPPARTLRVPTERGTKTCATAPKGATSLNLCLPLGEPGATGGRLTFLSLPPRGEMERDRSRDSVARFGKGGRTEWVG